MLSLTRLRKSRIFWCALAAAALLLTGFGWNQNDTTTYQTEIAQQGDIRAVVAAIGTLRPRESVDVGAQVSGQITRLHVNVGDGVEKGQLLVEIDPIVLQTTVDAGRAELAGLRAQLAEQQAQYELAEQRHQRQQQLAKARAISEEALQEAVANLKSSAARVAQLNAEIQQTHSNVKGNEAQLGFTRIYAPIAGTVISLEAKQGQTLNAAYQTPTIMTIADLSQMTVWTKVSEADIRRIKVDMPASFIGLAGDDRSWHGTVRQILPAPLGSSTTEGGSNEADTATTVIQYPVLFDVDNADGELRPQMTAQVNFVTASADNVLVIPLPAIQSSPKKPSIYQVRVLGAGDKTEVRDVRIGTRDRQNVEVLAGLSKGERVITGEQVNDEEQRLFQW